MHEAEAARHDLPAVIVGGWLGAGKTTLVNHLLRAAGGQRLAVLVNDFGDVAIDADLIVGAYRDVLALAGGCVCCSYGADLVGALQRVLAFDPRPERVLIECSGVALPAAVARTARLVEHVAVEAIVVLADAATLRERAADAYVGDVVRQQIDAADLVILNRCDEVDEATRSDARAWLARVAPATPALCAQRAAVDPRLLLGWLHDEHGHESRDEPRARATAALPQRPLRAAPSLFASETRRVDDPVDPEALGTALSASGALRAKGIVRGFDGRYWLVQTVGRRVECTPWSTQAPTSAGHVLVIRATAAPTRTQSTRGVDRPDERSSR